MIRRIDKRNVENIPFMLRALADDIESGHVVSPKSVFVITIGRGDDPPMLYEYGEEGSRLEEIGAVALTKKYLMETC